MNLCSLGTWVDIANIAGGFGTAAAAIWGLRIANKWREQTRETRRAEVAGEALVNVLRTVEHLRAIRSIFIPAKEDEEKPTPPDSSREAIRAEGARLGEVLDQRWNAFMETSNHFIDAWERAQVYLPDPCVELLNDVWQFRAETRARQSTFVRELRQGRRDVEAWERAFGHEGDEQLTALKARAISSLKKLASLDA